ncbi:MAG: amino acid adenylation domain-containing protein [Vicinamibacterales bacterium]
MFDDARAQHPTRPADERVWLNLSLAQQAVWLDATLSGASAYQLGGWARVRGVVDEATVRQSISLLMGRHDALRLRIDDELPRQWVDASVEPPVRVLVVPDGVDADVWIAAHLAEIASQPLPLGHHPLFRIELIRAGASHSYLVWRFHHLIADSVSVSVTLAHWFQIYDALASDTVRELAPGSSYLATIESDAAYLESATYQKDLAYWTARFEPLPPPLIADLDVHASGAREVPVAEWRVTGGEAAALRAAATRAATTVQRALFGLFAVTAGRRYGQTDVVAGMALHRRDAANRHTIGMLAGVIPVRCAFEPYWSVEECVQAFSEQVDADLRHQRLPVDVLSRAIGLASRGRAGLFEVAMSYLPNERVADASLGGQEILAGGDLVTREASPISLHVTERADGSIALRIAVNPDFLADTEAGSLADLYRRALTAFVADPSVRFEELLAITDDERRHVVHEWNATNAAFPTGRLDALVAAQAALTPDAVAVVGEDGAELTYAALMVRAEAVAEGLIARGVQPGSVVGVEWVRSLDTVVAIVGILRAGGVYLPLDPSYPAERRAFMASDAGAALVLTSLACVELAPHRREGRVGSQAALPSLTDDAARAYVIYTSGTTGQPKGVAVSHRAAVNLAYARRACHDPLGAGDRVLAAIAVGFDVSIGQLLLPLLSGATVVIAGDLKTLDATTFWSFLATRRVTHVNSVPSFLAAVLDAAPPPGSSQLKRIMLGGEGLPGSLVARLQAALPGVAVVNMYGPTETCIDATYHVATPADLGRAVLPIGRPLSNYRVYVLDGQQAPVGVGVSGELYIGGTGLAEGYIGQPALTASRFVADPFDDLGGRLYRTGDRARWRADGTLEFLGRVDQQVKIRGFRVEPEEIAAVLQTHAAVAQAAVVPHTTGGVVRLVAYVVPRGAAPEASHLREHVAAQLPDYMVPAAFVGLARIPLTPNGKLDIAALPSPDWQANAEFVVPRTSTEEAVAAIFAEVLNLPRCGATDHFFELGGDSLLATSLVSRMRGLSVTFPLRAVFETPTVDALARRIDEMWRQSLPQDHAVPSPRPDVLPLSYPQERIWFVDRLQHDSSYNIPLAFEVRGALDLDAVDAAVAQIVGRHEVLRTRIVLRDGRPVQEVVPRGLEALERIDLSDASSAERAAALDISRREVATRQFDLSAGAPLYGRVLVLEPNAYVLLLVIHHAACDGWSAGLFLREFAECYAAAVSGRAAALPSQRTQYADFAIWQRSQPQDENLAFWLEELRGAPARLELPIRSLPAAAEEPACGTVHLPLDGALVSALTSLGRAHGASLFMVLHAALASLFSRWSGQDDVVIGTVVANRQRTEFESAFGCFVNTLALRTTLTAGESFVQLLERVREKDLAAFAHQDLPFEQLVDALHPERSLDYAPVVQVMLVLQNTPQRAIALPGLTFTPQPIEPEAAKFDLTVNITEDDGGLGVSFEHARRRFDIETIEALAGQFAHFLRRVAADPQVEPAAVEMLRADERALVVERFNATAATFPGYTLEAMFARQVAAIPAAAAVVDVDGRTLSYEELDARSSALARYLVERGVVAERVVGVQMVRSADTIVALLGILKAGGVYLPLDPSYPADRLAYIAADAGAHLVLESIDGCDGVAPLPTFSDPSRLAYIIYTSGTTGRPKGVAMSHAALVNLSYARRACHDPLGPGDRVLAGIAVGFDVSIEQLLLPLLAGATVVVAGDLRTMGADGFWALLARERVTHVNSVPSFIASVLSAAPVHQPLALQRLIVGGEVLTGDLVARMASALPGVELVNVYGPTEACIEATYYVTSSLDHGSAGLPIGRPLSNYRAYVLDAHRQLVPPGVAGELYLGGAGLAREYVNAPDLTSERFLPDPYAPRAGGRMYRTGDRARWRRDGQLEFLGRVDEQVKIRGFRVEPGEIAAQLRLVSGVRDAAVVARASAQDVRLIAYYIADSAVHPEQLRHALAGVVPDYMVPSAFVAIEQLPLTPNGKLDTRALPAPAEDAFVTRSFEAPIGEAETRIAAVWCELLQKAQVGRHDNFFELGGHSLLVITLSERLRDAGYDADVKALFRTPTVAGLAAALTTAATDAEPVTPGIPADATAITPEMLPLVTLSQVQIDRIVASVTGGASNIQDIYPLAPLQEGIFFQHLMATEGDPYLTPFVLAFDSRARIDAFVDALQRVVGRYDALRTSLAWEGLDAPVQVVRRHTRLAVDEVPVEATSGALNQLLTHADPATVRLDVRQAPLVKLVAAWDRPNGRWLLLLLAHHLVLDHTSLEVIVNDVRLWMSDSTAVLPPTMPYRRFVEEARLAAASDAHATFFRERLADITEPTAPFGVLERAAGVPVREATRTVSGELAVRIRAQARVLGVSPAAIFHLAWGLVIGQTAGTRDAVFGTVLFGRLKSGRGASRAVGMFINTLPFRVSVTTQTVAAAVRETHEQLAALMAHEHAPLALAQRCSGVAAPAPLFSSLFNYRYSADASNAPWPGFEFVHASERTNYPLSMAVDDVGGAFLMTALGQSPCEPEHVCAYLDEATRLIVDHLEGKTSTPLDSISVLPEAERRLVLETWNATTEAFPLGRLEALVAEQATRTPDAVAVVDEDGTALTYAGLVARAERVARGLVARGVQPGAVVGVEWSRSLDTVVALLGILRAGAVYLPLDPAYPAERRAFMVADAGAALVMTSLADVEDSTSADVDTTQSEVGGLREVLPLPTQADASARAYIIYTSGTTGQPKGAAVSHAAAVNLAFARRACHDPLGVGDRVLAAIAVGFDVSIGQLLLPLLSGATVVIAGELKTLGASGFWQWLATRGVTHVNSVPSFIAAVLDAVPAADTLQLRQLMLGGEALTGALVTRLADALPGVRVVNMYGPTETCIDATYHVATREDLSRAVLPIGRPLSNYRVYVLDAQQRPVAIGVSGELYIGGAGLAEGYIGQPELTAARFVADPFGAPGECLYRTGDRARWRADGELDFLGRVDQQVKIRGFRVEPEEIAAVLRQHASVQDAVVVAQGTGADTRLVGYYTGEAVDVASLRGHLAARLPDYMIPSALVRLAHIPLTANGKLDVAALPKPELQPASAFVAPRTPTEDAVATLFAAALNLARCSATDHFFELGGDSLATMRLIAAANEHFGINLPVRALLEHATVAELAAHIDEGTSRTPSHLVPLQTSGSRTPLFCVHPAGGHALCYFPLSRELGDEQPLYGLQASGVEAGEPLASSIEQMAADYIGVMRRVQAEGPYQLLGMSSGGLIAFEMARQLRAAGHAVRLLAMLDTTVPDGQPGTFSDAQLTRAMAGELGCVDLLDAADGQLTLAALVTRALDAGRLPAGFTVAHAERLASVFRNTVTCHFAYRPQPLAVPAVVVRALQRERDDDQPPDWTPFIAGPLVSVDFDCSHGDLVTKAWAPDVASLLSSHLDGTRV